MLQLSWLSYFNPRPPSGERLFTSFNKWSNYANFNPRPPSGERRGKLLLLTIINNISIHALQAESDESIFFDDFYTVRFQSTPSKRRATGLRLTGDDTVEDFNPRPPSGERRRISHWRSSPQAISIHALQAESDFVLNWIYDLLKGFQSTPSKRRATDFCRWWLVVLGTFQSTPSKRRATRAISPITFVDCYFNPRPPSGERLHSQNLSVLSYLFQSTPSKRRATLLEHTVPLAMHYFNPRPPSGERLQMA